LQKVAVDLPPSTVSRDFVPLLLVSLIPASPSSSLLPESCYFSGTCINILQGNPSLMPLFMGDINMQARNRDHNTHFLLTTS
jgi:hypothetical protein